MEPILIDTHCHLIDEAFTSDVEACIVNALAVGVGKIMLACCDEKEFPQILDLCSKHPGILFPSIGIHPENMAEDIDEQLCKTKALLDEYMSGPQEQGKPAIGEIGIDLHWDKTRLSDQLTILKEQFDWALEYDLPVLLHIRDAMPEFLDFLKDYLLNNNKGKKLRGVLHCYSGTIDEAREAQLLADLKIGVGGTVTYKKSKVPEVAKALGLEQIILETDAPYLAPVPHRGKRNEPAYTADTAIFLSQLFECSPEEVARITTENAERLLGI